MSHRSILDITDKSFETDLIYSFGDPPSASRSISNIVLKSLPHMNVVSSAMSIVDLKYELIYQGPLTLIYIGEGGKFKV